MTIARLAKLVGIATGVVSLVGVCLAYTDTRYAPRSELAAIRDSIRDVQIETLRSRVMYLRGMMRLLEQDKTNHPLVRERIEELHQDIEAAREKISGLHREGR